MADTSYTALKDLLREMQGVLVAFSGGVDSSLLLAAAIDALGSSVLAVTGISPTFPEHDLATAKTVAARLHARWITLKTGELDDPRFSSNPPNRCYFCKMDLFSTLAATAQRERLPFVVEGSNADDLCDLRPGLAAARELGIRSPYLELGIGKDLIRRYARNLGLPNWDRPSSACLSSRIPFGVEITTERLRRIARSEEAIRRLGFSQVRVRDHDRLARIEVVPDNLPLLLDDATRARVVAACRDAGYAYVTVDLQGYRTGAMNETLTRTEVRKAQGA